ncbi:diguanylate cyclase domain-containing protein, partial [Citrobacter freundii]|uniref:diguanylate cyclase domain-containing protein n=1 Tax=Citrobacter freundii TaxID=546 RepID=UPI000FDC8BB5
AQDTKTGLSNRLFFDNQLATLLEDQEKVGSHGVVMMVRLPDFTLLRDIGTNQYPGGCVAREHFEFQSAAYRANCWCAQAIHR